MWWPLQLYQRAIMERGALKQQLDECERLLASSQHHLRAQALELESYRDGVRPPSSMHAAIEAVPHSPSFTSCVGSEKIRKRMDYPFDPPHQG